MKLDFGISPCPNDTFSFFHLSRTGVQGNPIRLVFADVEELNRRAIDAQQYPVTKLSYYAYSRLQSEYELLKSGSALGRGCGPILASYDSVDPADALKRIKRVLVPGRWTTAHLLLRLFLADQGCDSNKIEFVQTRYDEIIPSLMNGEADFGVIIHEERFTFLEQGLHKVQDLGEWWETETGHPIPLGCIAVRKDIPDGIRRGLETGIRSSIERARSQPSSVMAFIKEHSQSLSDQVIEAHIGLYVNQYSLDMGDDGAAAVKELLHRASMANIS